MSESKSNPEPTRVVGQKFESLASEWLVREANREGTRIKILARNLHFRSGELDLVLEETRGDGRIELVFVEVRFRAEGGWVDGVESVDHRKRARLVRAVNLYLADYRGSAQGVRIDILASNGCSWTHLRNAWYL